MKKYREKISAESDKFLAELQEKLSATEYLSQKLYASEVLSEKAKNLKISVADIDDLW